MINLDKVSSVVVDGRSDDQSIKNSLKALKHCSKGINFFEKIFISPKIENQDIIDEIKESSITHYIIKPLDWIEYSNFMINNLVDYIKSDFCLVVQWDGFILNPNLWTDEFLQYDYIGATWYDFMIQTSEFVFPEVKQSGRYSLVGNGGFSLRSKKLLEETKNAPFICDGPEDAYICQNYYEYFKNQGIKFAPNNIADKFSKESNASISWDNVFGFHGDKNLINHI